MPHEPTTPLPSERPEPQLLRFHLRHLFLGVTLVSCFCAAMVATDGPWPLVITGGVLLVGAHVLGNLVGTKLKESSADVDQWLRSRPGQRHEPPRITTQPLSAVKASLPPSTPLATSDYVARWTVWFVAGGMLLGLAAGIAGVAWMLGTQAGWAGWIVGTVSCGVLGAWLAFLGSTFSSIARHAWRHADEGSRGRGRHGSRDDQK